MAEKRERNKKAGEIPMLEWIAGGIGAAMVAAAIGFLLHEGLAGDHSAPDITVEIKDVAALRGGYRVRFEAANAGGEAAAAVVIAGEIAKGETILETSEVTLAYVPARSERGGGLFFTKDPRAAELRVRARSYEDP